MAYKVVLVVTLDIEDKKMFGPHDTWDASLIGALRVASAGPDVQNAERSLEALKWLYDHVSEVEGREGMKE